jgi:ribosomal protein S18 acetylase RimI-like enzyme
MVGGISRPRNVNVRHLKTSMMTLVPMTHTEYFTFVSVAIPAYATDKVASGQWSEAESLDLARQSFHALLPRGLETPDHHLFTICDESAHSLGLLWMAVQKRADKRVAYIYDIHIDPPNRRRGYATGALLALEHKAHELGFSGIVLHVFGQNAGAQALYAKLGFVATNITMFKCLGPERDS